MIRSTLLFSVPPHITTAFFAFLAALTIVAPRTSIATFFVCVVIAAIYLWRSKERFLCPGGLNLAGGSLLAFVGYCLINASWAVDTGEAYEKVALLGAVVVGCFVIVRMIAIGRDVDLHAAGKGLVVGVALGAAFLFVEVFTDQLILRTVYNFAPWTRSDIKHLTIENGIVTGIFFSDLNRGIATLTFALWPVLSILRYLLKERNSIAVSGAFFLVAALAIWGSTHESSKAGFVASLVIFGLAFFYLRAARWLLMAAWIAVLLLVVPMSIFVFSQGLQNSKWIQLSGQHRLFIWHETAQKTLETPVLGIGVRSIKMLNNRTSAEHSVKKRSGERYPRDIHRHSHNAYLQIWLELGALGVLLFGICGVVLLRNVSFQHQFSQKYLLASFTVFSLIAGLSWGVWQDWYQCVIALSSVTAVLGARVLQEQDARI